MQFEEMIAESKQEGRAAGIAEGREEERLAIARKMKDMGLTDEQIEEATGIKASEIE